MIYNPGKQNFKCEYCDGEFTEDYLIKLAAEEESKKKVQDAAAEEAKDKRASDNGDKKSEDDFTSHSALYNCPSCGAELVMDETTAATYCYYCQNPVVLAGRLTSDMRPDKVLPFTVDRDAAKKLFFDWARKKKFVPKDFFSSDRVEKMSGVYYPYWVADYDVDAHFSGTGEKVTQTSTDKEDITTTEYYEITRDGEISFENVARPALGKISGEKGDQSGVDRKLSDGVHPYDLSDDRLKDFSMAYLSGFMAEKRDVDAADVKNDVEKELKGYVAPLMTAGESYTSVNGTPDMTVRADDYSYCLLPAWVLTYKGSDKTVFHYTINGQTGKICGRLPLDKNKLWLTAISIGVAVAALVTIIGGLI